MWFCRGLGASAIAMSSILLARLHFGAEELLLYPRHRRPCQHPRQRPRPHAKC